MSDILPTVFLARHGETSYNAGGRLRGLANPDLDGLGVLQAERLAATFAARGIATVYSSPLQRAVHTAQIIADRAGVPHHVDDGFTDRDYGPWTGKLKTDVVDRYESVDNAPGVEATQSVLDRVLPRLNSLDVQAGAPVVIVSHDAVIRPLLRALHTDLDPTVPNGSWAQLERTPRRWEVISYDNLPATP